MTKQNKLFEGYKPQFYFRTNENKQQVRDWQKDMELCQQLNQWYENPWEAGQEDGSRVIEIYEIIPEEPCNFVAECDNDLTTNFIMESRQALPYWLQQYAAEKERADRLYREMEDVEAWKEEAAIQAQFYLESEAREKKLREARPIDEWHEDYGDMLWWTFPIEEAPYCGNPLCSDWPGYHTHWTPFIIPDKEEEA